MDAVYEKIPLKIIVINSHNGRHKVPISVEKGIIEVVDILEKFIEQKENLRVIPIHNTIKSICSNSVFILGFPILFFFFLNCVQKFLDRDMLIKRETLESLLNFGCLEIDVTNPNLNPVYRELYNLIKKLPLNSQSTFISENKLNGRFYGEMCLFNQLKSDQSQKPVFEEMNALCNEHVADFVKLQSKMSECYFAKYHLQDINSNFSLSDDTILIIIGNLIMYALFIFVILGYQLWCEVIKFDKEKDNKLLVNHLTHVNQNKVNAICSIFNIKDEALIPIILKLKEEKEKIAFRRYHRNAFFSTYSVENSKLPQELEVKILREAGLLHEYPTA